MMIQVFSDGLYRNPDLYDDPDKFNPERFVNNEFGTKLDIDTATLRSDFHFGGGRVRITICVCWVRLNPPCF